MSTRRGRQVVLEMSTGINVSVDKIEKNVNWGQINGQQEGKIWSTQVKNVPKSLLIHRGAFFNDVNKTRQVVLEMSTSINVSSDQVEKMSTGDRSMVNKRENFGQRSLRASPQHFRQMNQGSSFNRVWKGAQKIKNERSECLLCNLEKKM